jgi:hypothetical protein
MSPSNQNQPESSDEQQFIQRAMADIDKAEKVQKIKQIVVISILFGALLWLVIREPGPGITSGMVFLAVMAGIARILFRIESNARAVHRLLAVIAGEIRALANRRGPG